MNWTNFKATVKLRLNRLSSFDPAVVLPDQSEFELADGVLALYRIKLMCIAQLVLSVYFFYGDLVVFREVGDQTFRLTLFAIHLIAFAIAAVYLLAYQAITRLSLHRYRLLVNVFAFLAIFIGVVAGINSHRLTGNIDAYVIIVLVSAVALPLKPFHAFFILLINQTALLFSLNVWNEGRHALVSQQFNSLGTVIIAFALIIIFYNQRRQDFLNKARLKQSEENLGKLFDINPYALLLARLGDSRIIKVNHKAEAVYPLFRDNPYPVSLEELYGIDRSTGILAQMKESGNSIHDMILEYKPSDGSARWGIMNCETIDYQGEKCVLIGSTDITELKKMEEELAQYASLDPLTGVFNRRKGMELLEQAVEEARAGNRDFSLCFLDIDCLKRVNDLYGHSEGDYLINKVCRIIQMEMAPDDVLFRFGGDEFIVLLFGQERAEVERTWKEIAGQFDFLNQSHHRPYPVKVSCGILHCPLGIELNAHQIIQEADQEMYKAKAVCKPE